MLSGLAPSSAQRLPSTVCGDAVRGGTNVSLQSWASSPQGPPDMNVDLDNLGRPLVGRWTTEATHPAMPGTVIAGSSHVEWLDGEKLPALRNSLRPPQLPGRNIDHRRHGRTPDALLRHPRRPPTIRVDRVRGRMGDRDGGGLTPPLIRIERSALLTAHYLHLRGRRSEDVRARSFIGQRSTRTSGTGYGSRPPISDTTTTSSARLLSSGTDRGQHRHTSGAGSIAGVEHVELRPVRRHHDCSGTSIPRGRFERSSSRGHRGSPSLRCS